MPTLSEYLAGASSVGSVLYEYGTQITTSVIDNVTNNFTPSEASISSNFSYDIFPEDIGSDYNGHYMTITAINGGAPTGAGTQVIDAVRRRQGLQSQTASITPNQSQYAAVIFIPGATSGSGIVNHDVHEYADIKLMNLARDYLGVSAGPLQGITGLSINPGVQVLYRNTALRSFQFQFFMAPASPAESASMESIIQNLRYWAAPRADGVMFQTPAEFQIRFFNKGQENTHLPRIRRCVLNRIDTDYTPMTGEWSTFRNGQPLAVLLSLNFQEMEIIHKDFIAGGN